MLTAIAVLILGVLALYFVYLNAANRIELLPALICMAVALVLIGFALMAPLVPRLR